MLSVIDRIRNEITFKKSYLGDIVESLNLSREINEVKDGNVNAKTPFSNEEKREIAEFFSSLGKSDIDGESGKLVDAKTKFSSRFQKASKSYEENGKLAVKLGILSAIAVLIIFM